MGDYFLYNTSYIVRGSLITLSLKFFTNWERVYGGLRKEGIRWITWQGAF